MSVAANLVPGAMRDANLLGCWVIPLPGHGGGSAAIGLVAFSFWSVSRRHIHFVEVGLQPQILDTFAPKLLWLWERIDIHISTPA